MKRILLTIALLSFAHLASAQTFVLSCLDNWGSAENCGGCNSLKWSAADANDKVQTSDRSNTLFEYWTRLADLPANAPVSIATGKTEGAAATCAQITGTKTAGELLGTVTVPNPPPVTPPAVGTGFVKLDWLAPLQNIDGSALTNLSGYRVEWFLSGASNGLSYMVTSPGVLTYTVTGLLTGTYTFRVYSEAGTAESAPATLSNIDIVGSPVTPPPPPAPVDCVVSSWSAWVPGTFSACANGTQSRTDTRSRIVLAPASNGGAACPTLTDSQTVTQVCVVPKVWKVAKNGTSSTRPAYEAVLPLTGIALVQGNQDGTIAVGAPCLGEVFKIGTTSYRAIANSDAALASPTYAGRLHVAICTLQ